TKTTRFKGQHQIEYEGLFNHALQRYKITNGIEYVVKETRDKMHQMLRQRLIIDYITNLNFRTTLNHNIVDILIYYKSFTRNPNALTAQQIRQANYLVAAEAKKELPPTPEQIPKEIQEMLPFKLPIKKKSEIVACAAMLRRVYNFAKLPKEYIIELEPPP